MSAVTAATADTIAAKVEARAIRSAFRQVADVSLHMTRHAKAIADGRGRVASSGSCLATG
jgi:hypothetical protein